MPTRIYRWAGRFIGVRLVALLIVLVLMATAIMIYSEEPHSEGPFRSLVWSDAPASLKFEGQFCFRTFGDGSINSFVFLASPDVADAMIEALELEPVVAPEDDESMNEDLEGPAEYLRQDIAQRCHTTIPPTAVAYRGPDLHVAIDRSARRVYLVSFALFRD